MNDKGEASSSTDADATAQAMAAMGLPTSFSTPSAAAFGGPSARQPPSGPSNRSAQGRGGGGGGGGQRGRASWRGGRGGAGFAAARDTGYDNAARQQLQQRSTHEAPSDAPSGPRNFGRARGSEKRKWDGRNDGGRERGGALHVPVDEELVPLDDIPPLIRPSMTEADPWAHLY